METFQSEQINELAAAIVKAQLAIVPAVKDHVNPFFKSKYADLPSVWEAAVPFRDNGIAITQSPMDAPDEYIVLDTQLTHISGQWMRSRLKIRVAKSDPQGYGSALTYARRYALGCMTGIVTEEDDDGNAASQPQKAQAYTQQKQTAQAKINELRTEKFMEVMKPSELHRKSVEAEMQEPARQEAHKHALGTSATGANESMPEQQQGSAAPCFIWKMGKWKDTHIADLPLDYLAWACTNISRDDHRLAAADEIDRRQKQDVMAFEGQE